MTNILLVLWIFWWCFGTRSIWRIQSMVALSSCHGNGNIQKDLLASESVKGMYLHYNWYLKYKQNNRKFSFPGVSFYSTQLSASFFSTKSLYMLIEWHGFEAVDALYLLHPVTFEWYCLLHVKSWFGITRLKDWYISIKYLV